MARNLTRNTKLYISNQGTLGSCDSANCWEVKILDGYSFAQSTTTEDITIDEAGSTPIRGQKTFNVAQDPVDVSITTYIRPYLNNASIVDAPERILWSSLSSRLSTVTNANGDMIDTTPGNGNGIQQQASGTGMSIDFEESDSNELGKLTLWFHLENSTYRVDEVNFTTAEIDFAIDTIAQIAWTGMGTGITELSSADHATIAGWTSGTGGTGDYRAVPATTSASFLRNKLSTMTLVNNQVQAAVDAFASGTIDAATSTTVDDDGTDALTIDEFADKFIYIETSPPQSRKVVSNTVDVITVDKAFSPVPSGTEDYRIINADQHAGQEYVIAITGGSLTIENNMDFLTPEELGVVNQPLPGFAGSRAVTGNVTAYLDTGVYGTAALLQDLLDDINNVTNSYNFTLSVGGTNVATKRVDLNMATAQISVPTIDVQDVIATDITLAGQGSAGLLENQDELVATYHSA